jgi:Protein of unknown function (DUF1826)
MTSLALRSFSISSDPEILDDVLKPDRNLAVWKRDNISGFDAVLDNAPTDFRFTAPKSHLPDLLPSKMDAHGFVRSATRAAFEADIIELATRYCTLLSLDELEVRLELVTTNSCRKWHSDYVRARLISTYVGQGTQWLDGSDAIRVKQGLDPIHVHSMKAGDVGIFKGKLATNTPAIHRSPPIGGSGETRLLLVLNPPEER